MWAPSQLEKDIETAVLGADLSGNKTLQTRSYNFAGCEDVDPWRCTYRLKFSNRYDMGNNSLLVYFPFHPEENKKVITVTKKSDIMATNMKINNALHRCPTTNRMNGVRIAVYYKKEVHILKNTTGNIYVYWCSVMSKARDARAVQIDREENIPVILELDGEWNIMAILPLGCVHQGKPKLLPLKSEKTTLLWPMRTTKGSAFTIPWEQNPEGPIVPRSDLLTEQAAKEEVDKPMSDEFMHMDETRGAFDSSDEEESFHLSDYRDYRDNITNPAQSTAGSPGMSINVDTTSEDYSEDGNFGFLGISSAPKHHVPNLWGKKEQSDSSEEVTKTKMMLCHSDSPPPSANPVLLQGTAVSTIFHARDESMNDNNIDDEENDDSQSAEADISLTPNPPPDDLKEGDLHEIDLDE